MFKKAPLVTTSSFNAVFNEVGPFLSFPGEVSKISKIKTGWTTKDRRTPYWVDEMYKSSKKLVLNFEQKTDNLVEEIIQKDIDTIFKEYKENREDLEKNYKEVDEFLIKLEKDVISDLNSPTTFFNAKRFYKLSKFMFKRISKLDKELEDEIKKYAKQEIQKRLEKELKTKRELARFIMFVTLQPYFIAAYILADLRNDMEFLTEYKKLLNRFSHFVAKRNLELYKNIFKTEEVKYKSQAFNVFKGGLRKSRNAI